MWKQSRDFVLAARVVNDDCFENVSLDFGLFSRVWTSIIIDVHNFGYFVFTRNREPFINLGINSYIYNSVKIFFFCC